MTATLARESTIRLMPAETIRTRMAGLRRATAPLHEEVERLVAVNERLTTMARYCSLLARLYGIYLPLEEQIGPDCDRWGLPLDIEARQKAPLIERDLLALGLRRADIDLLPACADLPTPARSASVLGCLYVLEGATLGGKVIARHAQRTLRVCPERGAAFFSCYGPGVGRRWQAFCSLLAASLDGGSSEREIVRAASETFLAFGRWLADDSTIARESRNASGAPFAPAPQSGLYRGDA